MKCKKAVCGRTAVMLLGLALVLPTPLNAWAQADAPVPSGQRLFWGEEPVEKVSSTRARVVLNGLWKFQPGIAGAKEPQPTGWGYLPVPGSWRIAYSAVAIPQVASPGNGPMWDAWKADTLDLGWYERTLRIPADWQGRTILLNFARLSTDAWVFIDGKEAGRVAWPAGEVDLTGKVTPGREHTLRVFVATIPSAEQVGIFMGPGAGQVSFANAQPESKGIIDDVTLESRPANSFISDVFVQPSTRKKRVTLDIELTNVTQSGPMRLTARMERNGSVEQTLTQIVTLKAAPVQTVRVTWPWADAARWDLDAPNLYTVKLRASGAGVEDEYAQEFGFREFWIEGRQMFLNGIPFRFRPQVMPQEWSPVSGTREYVEGGIKGMRYLGYNIGEMWPGGSERRGQHSFHHIYYDAADRLGFPLMGSAGNVNDYIGWGQGDWKSPQAKAEWERLTRRELRMHRNHPSIFLWSTSGNSFGHANDQNPLAIGRPWQMSGLIFSKDEVGRARTMESALAFMRREDPTRGAFVHQGILGDLWAVNSYLNFIPLQEEEEWLSAWSQHGDRPYLPIEFGTPLGTSFQRGREHYGQAEVTEPWLSEFAAIYLGSKAYRIETPDYRRAMREKFKGGQEYQSWQGDVSRNYSPANMLLQSIFTTRIWRSWRTLGTTAGMLPWEGGYATRTIGAAEEIDAPPFQPGRRGTYSPKLRKSNLFSNQPQGGAVLTPAGDALVASNGETLAYIGGKASPQDIAAVTDKQHAFWSGETIEKTAVLLNDTRRPQPYTVSWTATVGGKRVGAGIRRGTVAVAQNLFVPISFRNLDALPVKTNGVLELMAKIGNRSHHDTFAFRVWPRPPAQRSPAGSVAVFDPQGRTSMMLRALGYTIRPWDGHATKDVVVIGRDALSMGATPPANLNAFVKGGGRVLVMEQKPGWLERTWGFRVSAHVARYVFPIDGTHPVGKGLDALDLRDWAGASAERPSYTPTPPLKNEELPYGWHWGNRGGVSSAAIEKPHLSGWRPLLECDFDGAYSPLMELDMGRGRAILCQLDLEERFSNTGWAREPAADRLARQLIRYAAFASLQPCARRTVLLGTAPAWFELLGVQHEKAVSLPADADLVIVAPDVTIARDTLEGYLRGGGKVVFLPRQARTAGSSLGITLTQKISIGSYEVPRWGTTSAGLSPSDLRWRNEASAWLVTAGPGWDRAADGQLAQRRVGKGLAVWLQIDPERFDADIRTYFRFTRWRQTRAIAQVLANLGATFRDDAAILRQEPRPPTIVPLAGTWEYAITIDLPAATASGALKDPGISDVAQALLDGKQPLKATMQVPGTVPGFDVHDGEAVVRRVIDIPKSYIGKDLILEIGKVDDFDTTFWNGEVVGSMGADTPDAWNTNRRYTIPARLVKPGRNMLAIRIWDWYGGGGLFSPATDLSLRPASDVPAFLYHPDYRTDFISGDNPFRYKRW